MAGQNDGSTRPGDRNLREEIEERKLREHEDAQREARQRRRRIGHAGAAAGGIAAGGLATGAADELDIVDQITGEDEAAAAEADDATPSLDIFDEIVQERADQALDAAADLMEQAQSAVETSRFAASVMPESVPDMGPPPTVGDAPAEDVPTKPPAGSSRPPAISPPGPPAPTDDDDAVTPSAPDEAVEDAPEPTGAAPAPPTAPGAPPPIFSSPGPPPAPDPASTPTPAPPPQASAPEADPAAAPPPADIGAPGASGPEAAAPARPPATDTPSGPADGPGTSEGPPVAPGAPSDPIPPATPPVDEPETASPSPEDDDAPPPASDPSSEPPSTAPESPEFAPPGEPSPPDAAEFQPPSPGPSTGPPSTEPEIPDDGPGSSNGPPPAASGTDTPPDVSDPSASPPAAPSAPSSPTPVPPSSSGPTPSPPESSAPPGSGSGTSPVGVGPSPGSSDDGDDIVVDAGPGTGPPPPPTDPDVPEPPPSDSSDDESSESAPPDSGPTDPGQDPSPPPPDGGQSNQRYLGEGNSYPHPADAGDPIAVYDDYPLGPGGPASIALYEGGASIAAYPNGRQYIQWHVDENLDPVEFTAGEDLQQFEQFQRSVDFGVSVDGNEVDVLVENLEAARLLAIDDLNLEGYPGLADPAALGREPVREEISETGLLVRYYETPDGGKIIHSVQRTDETIVNIVFPDGVMVEQVEGQDEPYIYFWDEEADSWQQVVWDEDYNGYLPAVYDRATGEYVGFPPDAEYTYEELLEQWQGQELGFPDAVGHIGAADYLGPVDPQSLIERFGEPEIIEDNGYYQLSWTTENNDTITQRLYNDGSGRVIVEYSDSVRATYLDGELDVEVFSGRMDAWLPTTYVEEWGIYFYATPDPYTGEMMLAAFDPATEAFVPGILNEAGDWTVPAAYNAETGQWEEAVYDLATGDWVLPEDAVQPAYWDEDSDSWVATSPDYGQPDGELDFSGQIFGPDGGYPFPGDVAEVLFYLNEDLESASSIAVYSNGATVMEGESGLIRISWWIDQNGNPVDFSSWDEAALQEWVAAPWSGESGSYEGFGVVFDANGDTVYSGLPWNFTGLTVDDIEGLDWTDPALAYGLENAEVSFGSSGPSHSWTLPDGTVVQRILDTVDGDWYVFYGEPPSAYHIYQGADGESELFVWSSYDDGWVSGVWDPYLDQPIPAIYDETTGDLIPAIWDEATDEYVAASWDESTGSWLPVEDYEADQAAPPIYNENYLPAEDNIPEMLDPIHPDTVLLRYPDGSLHEFGLDDGGGRYHYMIDPDTGSALEVLNGDPFLLEVEPQPVFMISENYYTIQPGGTLRAMGNRPTEEDIVESIDTERGIVVTRTGSADGALREFDLDGDITYVTYVYPDGARGEREISSDLQLLSVDEVARTATFIDSDGDIFQLDSSGYRTVLALSSDSAANGGLVDYQLPEDPEYFLWDEEQGAWRYPTPDIGEPGSSSSDEIDHLEYLGPDGASYANPFLVDWGNNSPQELAPANVVEVLGWPTPEAAAFFPDGSVGAIYADGTYRVAWIEDANGDPVQDWEQAADGSASVEYQVYTNGPEILSAEGGPDAMDSNGAAEGEPDFAGQYDVPPDYPGFNPADYPDNDVQAVLQAADPDGFRARLSDGDIYEWTADGYMYHIQTDAHGQEYATAIQGGPTFDGYVNGMAQFDGFVYVNNAGQLQLTGVGIGRIQEIDVEGGYVAFEDAIFELRGDTTYRIDPETGEATPDNSIRIAELDDNPPNAILMGYDDQGALSVVYSIASGGTATALWMSEDYTSIRGLNPAYYQPDDGAEPLYYVDGGWAAVEQTTAVDEDEDAAEEAQQIAESEGEDVVVGEPSDTELEEADEEGEERGEQIGTIDTTPYLGPDGASYAHPFAIYDASPIVDAAEAAEALGWPQGGAAYLYPGGELVMHYGDGSTRIAWLENTETGTPITSFEDVRTGQATIDYAVQTDANGQVISTMVQSGSNVTIEPTKGTTVEFVQPEETPAESEEAPAEDAADEVEEEFETLDFFEEAPAEDESASEVPEAAEEAGEAADVTTLALGDTQPDVEATQEVVPESFTNADTDALSPTFDDIEDDAALTSEDDGMP